MSWNRIKSLLRAQSSGTPPEIGDIDDFETANESTIPINIEEAKFHEYPSEPNLDVLPDGRHTYQSNDGSLGLLSVPGECHKLKRTASLDTKYQFARGRAPSTCSLISEFNSEGNLKISLSGGSRKSRPVREIFYREETTETSKERSFSGGIELSSLQQSGVDTDGEKETLHSLARRGNTQEIRVLLQQNEDIDKRDSYGKTPLHCAVSAGQIATVKYLLHCHGNPNLKDHREEAPLHVAVRTGNVDIVEVLLNHQSTDVNIEGRSRYTPLHTASHLEHRNALEICQKLLDCNADVTKRAVDQMTPLSVATMKGAYETMAIFFKKFEEIRSDSKKQLDILYSVDFEGSTLLHLSIDSGVLKRVDGGTSIHLACRLGALEIMKCLYEHDKTMFTDKLVDREGMTPLHRAAMFNHPSVVSFLVEHGMNLNPRDRERCTPLLLAAAHGCSIVVSLLLEKDADVTCKDDKNRTALHWAVGQDKTIERLLKDERVQENKLVNQQDSTGATTLHYAAQGGFLKSVLLLLKNGADTSLKNHKLETPLHLAASHGWIPIVKKLMEGRQTRLMNVGNLSDHTPLHLAASNGQEKVVKFLLDRGATIERDTEGRTALHFAAAKGSLRSVQLICNANPNCINDEDNADQDAALHLAARNGHDSVVNFLLSHENQNVTYNACNQNALDVAIESLKTNVTMMIAHHTRWREMCHRVEEGPTQLQNLVIKMPAVAETFLDRCVEECGTVKDEDFSITYDFMFLQGMPDIRKDDPKKFLDCLHTMVKHKRVNCLSHSVCGAIMNIKWRSVGWKAYVMNLSFYMLFLLLLTTMTVLLDSEVEENMLIEIPKYTIIVMCLFHLLKEIFQIWDEKLKYLFKADNWMEWFLYMSSLVYMTQYYHQGNYAFVSETTRPLAATAIFVAWVIFVLYLRRFSTFGIYIIMMTNIIKTLIKIIILFIPFTIAFGIPFYLLLNRDYPKHDLSLTKNVTLVPKSKSNLTDNSGREYIFNKLHYSLFTTFMLILGEMKYPHTVFKYQPINHPIISYIIYIIFCLCMPIIIKNLLIGLSVGDVNRILQTAKMEQHAMQVELLLELERATPRKILRKIWVSYYVEFPNRMKTWRQKLTEFGSPKRTTSNQESYVNPALVAITEKLEKLTKKVDQQEDK
ncbi:hypothetical protein QZH41_011655 [Actinostola sp. cb2023]|nr:hypothetical protein QZH41_011655 [Actinostola sp. cb2023]